jgi:hypothetical protein
LDLNFQKSLEPLRCQWTKVSVIYNDERFAPGTQNSGKQNPEEPILHSNLCPFHYDQLFAKRKVLGYKIRGYFEPSVFIIIPAWQVHANLSIISESTIIAKDMEFLNLLQGPLYRLMGNCYCPVDDGHAEG